MPQYTFEGPGGQRHTIEGPEGATKEQAFHILQQHLDRTGQAQQQQQSPGLLKSAASGLIQGAGAPGDFSEAMLSYPPAQKPIDKDTYYGKLVDALNVARKHLELPTTQNVGNAVGMQPTTPVTGAETAVQRGASMIPGAMMGGNPAGRAMMGAAPAANAVRGMGMAPTQGAASRPVNTPQVAGNTLQTQLLKQGLEHGASTIGHALGGPLGGMAGRAAARFAPKMLGME